MATTKPVVKLIGQDGNVFNLIGIVSKQMKKAGLRDEANKFVHEAFGVGSYNEVLVLIQQYCEVE